MKKLLALTLGLISTTVMAANTQNQATTNGQPAAFIRVLDMSGKTPRPIEGNKVSLSKKQQLCWGTLNMTLTGKTRVTETFHSPAATKFTSDKDQSYASNDKKEFVIVSEVMPSNGAISRCWQLEKKDPIGKYTLDVQVGDINFAGLKFEVVK
ncbi:hypothetical protein [Actinobacillus porcinus]|uniref:hypothetical protein n=1 Tax=Actinobacillus porcinus TaxID=51048 RepID=UPI002A91861A|nr:hypothetical protein [Actinobacillus porcinus]MDY6215813.1 hypothetical protein [Actinobacillus porcinus]